MQKSMQKKRAPQLSTVPQNRRCRAGKMDPGARKQAILDAALDVFADHGFEAARLDNVAARAGVAKGNALPLLR
jgi:AcrR family transcriptional regulator